MVWVSGQGWQNRDWSLGPDALMPNLTPTWLLRGLNCHLTSAQKSTFLLFQAAFWELP